MREERVTERFVDWLYRNADRPFGLEFQKEDTGRSEPFIESTSLRRLAETFECSILEEFLGIDSAIEQGAYREYIPPAATFLDLLPFFPATARLGGQGFLAAGNFMARRAGIDPDWLWPRKS